MHNERPMDTYEARSVRQGVLILPGDVCQMRLTKRGTWQGAWFPAGHDV